MGPRGGDGGGTYLGWGGGGGLGFWGGGWGGGLGGGEGGRLAFSMRQLYDYSREKGLFAGTPASSSGGLGRYPPSCFSGPW